MKTERSLVENAAPSSPSRPGTKNSYLTVHHTEHPTKSYKHAVSSH